MEKNTIARMTDEGSSAVVIHTPQCVDCRYNQGLMNCEALVVKPTQYMMNQETCPMYEKENE